MGTRDVGRDLQLYAYALLVLLLILRPLVNGLESALFQLCPS